VVESRYRLDCNYLTVVTDMHITGTVMETAFNTGVAMIGTGEGISWSVVNTSASFTATVALATGNSVVGNMVVGTSGSASFKTIRTGTNTFTTYRV
jgi:hypothetical protein